MVAGLPVHLGARGVFNVKLMMMVVCSSGNVLIVHYCGDLWFYPGDDTVA